MLRKNALFILPAVVVSVLIWSDTSRAASLLIDFTTDTGNGTTLGTGVQLDANANIANDLPVSVDVFNTDPADLGTVGAVGTLVNGLILTVNTASSFDSANTTLNASGATFGLNSPTPPGGAENAARFDAEADETLTFSFNQSVRIISAEFGSFSGEETFTLGGVTFGNSQFSGGNLPLADSGDVFTFAGSGLELAANEGFSLEAGGPADSSVGLVALTIEIVPEPSAVLLLGFGSFAVLLCRRR